MAISKITLNGVTQMDVTQDTVDENNLLSGETATKANGVRTTGTVVTANVDPTLTISGDAADAKVTGDAINAIRADDTYSVIGNSSFTHNSGTFNGVTFAWSNNNTVLTLNGTASRAFFTNLYVDYTAFPTGMNAGETYYITVNTTNSNLALSILPYASGQSLITQYNFYESSFFTMPSNAVGCIIRVTGSSGVTYNNATVSNIGIYKEGKNLRVVAGVIRNSGSGWNFINDSGHYPMNLDRVGLDANGNVVVYYNFTAKKVLSFIAAPDDDFAKIYTCGSSVGLSYATISIYSIPQTVGGLITYNNNTWDKGFSDFNAVNTPSTGLIEVTHGAVPTTDTSLWFDISATPWRGAFGVYIQSVTAQSFQFKMFDTSGNQINTPPSGGGVILKRTTPAVRMNANDVVSASGNIWLYGIFEV